ncbi:MAG: hypothetical protein M3Z11_02615 [Candidatus Dormibacteraeota bacterium]|nr:hypothetical protein [Candidatus Dormibacteraeota bacterium]
MGIEGLGSGGGRSFVLPRLRGVPSLGAHHLAPVYIAAFGSLQVLILWTYRERFGVLIPALGLALLLLLVFVMLRVRDGWMAKVLLLGGLIAVTTFGPSIIGMVQRQHAGLTFEVDGLAMDEVAIDRLMHGHAIYGVDWSGTQVDGYADFWGGVDLHDYPHFPLMPLSAIPIKVVTDALHAPFDYRMAVLLSSLIALAAIALIPVALPARMAVAAAVFLNPSLSLMSWTGHDDIRYLALLLLGLALLGRRQLLVATLAFGIAAALKPFALLVVPLLLVVIWYRSRSPRDAFRTGSVAAVTFSLPIVLSVGPFLLIDAGSFVHDVLTYLTTTLPISGFGLGGLLVALHVVSPNAHFSFAPLEIIALIPAYWFGLRAFARRMDLGQFLLSYCVALFALFFFARYFGDNYLAGLISLVLCVPALISVGLGAPETRTVA